MTARPRKTYAMLGRDGLLTEYRTLTRPPAGQHVQVPDGCDLAPRRYRWAGETFVPVVGIDGAPLANDPTDLHCIALGFASLHNAGVDLHPETVEWLRRYARTVDNKVPDERRVTLTR